MAKLLYKALSNGTMSNPYREIVKDDIIELTEVEAEFYKNSKWLRPKKEVEAIKPQPIMSGMRMEQLNGKTSMDFLTLMNRDNMADKVLTPSPMPESYNKQIAALQKKEALEDGDANEGEATGTGNLDPLG